MVGNAENAGTVPCAWRSLALALLAVLVWPASAAAWSIHVVDETGRPQVAALYRVGEPQATAWAGANGVITVADPTPGAYRITRSQSPAPCGAPEGEGVPVTWEPGARTAVVRLPTLVEAPFEPAVDATEQLLIDQWQARRAALGLRPVTLDASLTQAADWYAKRLSDAQVRSHCLGSGPAARAHAARFTGTDVRELIADATSPELALQLLFESPDHRATLEAAELVRFGVGRAGNMWVIKAGADEPPRSTRPTIGAAETNIGPAAQGGAAPVTPTAADRATPPAAVAALHPGTITSGRVASLRLRVTRTGTRATIRFTAVPGEGVRYLRVRRGSWRRSFRLATDSVTLRLPRRGTYTVSAYFAGSGGWANRRLLDRRVRVR